MTFEINTSLERWNEKLTPRKEIETQPTHLPTAISWGREVRHFSYLPSGKNQLCTLGKALHLINYFLLPHANGRKMKSLCTISCICKWILRACVAAHSAFDSCQDSSVCKDVFYLNEEGHPVNEWQRATRLPPKYVVGQLHGQFRSFLRFFFFLLSYVNAVWQAAHKCYSELTYGKIPFF